MTDGEDQSVAFDVVRSYKPGQAARMVTWGVALAFMTPALVALAWATGTSYNRYSGQVGGPNSFVMLLVVAAGIATAVCLVAGSRRAAMNADYVAAVTYLRVRAEREAQRAPTEPTE